MPEGALSFRVASRVGGKKGDTGFLVVSLNDARCLDESGIFGRETEAVNWSFGDDFAIALIVSRGF